MTENTSTGAAFHPEKPEPALLDPGTFDLDSWLTGGTAHRPTKSVTVYRDLNLNAELEAALARLEALEKVTDKDGNTEEELGGDEEINELRARVEELAQRMRATTATVTVVGLTRVEQVALQEQFDPKVQPSEFEYATMAEAGTFQGRKLTAEQWARLNDTIGPGQWQRIVSAYQAAVLTVPEVTAPFSRKLSRPAAGG